jgi:hypothetical protein
VFRLKESNAPGENLRFARMSLLSAAVGILQPDSASAERTTKAAGPGNGRMVMMLAGQVAQKFESRRLDARGTDFLTYGKGETGYCP